MCYLLQEHDENSNNAFLVRHLLRAIPKQITKILQADALWSKGITGEYVIFIDRFIVVEINFIRA